MNQRQSILAAHMVYPEDPYVMQSLQAGTIQKAAMNRLRGAFRHNARARNPDHVVLKEGDNTLLFRNKHRVWNIAE
ncbi:DUF2642 domain-containing protein [Paenibacillus marinisediminis]